jgi:predicted transcriptional regulator
MADIRNWLDTKNTQVKGLVARAEKAEKDVEKAQRVALSAWMSVGKVVTQIHNKIGGDFRRWADEEWPLGRVRAYELEQVFVRFSQEGIPDGVTSLTALTVLSRAPMAMRTRAIERMHNGERLTLEDARAYRRGEEPTDKTERETMGDLRERCLNLEAQLSERDDQMVELEEQNERLKDTVRKLKADMKSMQRRMDDMVRQSVGVAA